MLLIDNETVKCVLTTRDCIEAQERAFAGTLTGASVSRPRIDMFVPCDRADAYYRWGSVEGARCRPNGSCRRSRTEPAPRRLGSDATRCGFCRWLIGGIGRFPFVSLADTHLQAVTICIVRGARRFTPSPLGGEGGMRGLRRCDTENIVTPSPHPLQPKSDYPTSAMFPGEVGQARLRVGRGSEMTCPPNK